MSDKIKTDEINKFVSSVRDFVAHKEAKKPTRRVKSELLVLTSAYRVGAGDGSEPLVEYVPAAMAPPSNVLHLASNREPEAPSLESTIAELEAAVTAQPGDWEADEGESFETSAWAASAFQAPVDDSPAPVEPEPEALAPAEPEQDALDMSSMISREVEAAITARTAARSALQEMTEDTLREMIVDIIRDELTGELGEKITRNVRKLVRREINRTIASQALR